ncbi:methylmalonyl-CoA mutase family protein [Bacillus suaedae]|uniref:Methylmalonyl-CoA mutase alpha/beta chain catalytic domain-containing protein n=1 Tax=Halalkalibacter suaedae TaxID=2822140 RepID=A0A940WSG1_9BACI|nr:hypothetical protein [Bacillus suaedae]
MNNSDFPYPTNENWQNLVNQTLSKQEQETEIEDGIRMKLMYRRDSEDDSMIPLTEPGRYPYVRGTTSHLKPCLISQELVGQDPRMVNAKARLGFLSGLDVYHICLDESIKGVNQAKKNEGVILKNVNDIETLLRGIDFTKHRIHLDTGVVSLPILAALKLLIDEGDINSFKGIIGADPLHQFVNNGLLSYANEDIYLYMAQAVQWTKRYMPSIKPILVQTHFYHNHGACPSSEIAIALSTGLEYVRQTMQHGVAAIEASTGIAFSYSIGDQFFTEISKIRAFRVLWAAIMREIQAGEKAEKAFIHAKTSELTRNKTDPSMNIVTGATRAFASLLAGVNSLHVSPHTDEEPTSFAERIARNTTLILRDEASLSFPLDSIGGAWYVEQLTEELAKKAWEKFQKIEAAGGMDQAIKEGVIDRWLTGVNLLKPSLSTKKKKQKKHQNDKVDLLIKELQRQLINKASFVELHRFLSERTSSPTS